MAGSKSMVGNKSRKKPSSINSSTIVKKYSATLNRNLTKFCQPFETLCNYTLGKMNEFFYQPKDCTALALFRILFGFLMFIDVPQERGLEDADLRFGDENYCFFPLFEFIQPLSLPYACVLYSIMWTGAFGIMFGLYFRFSCVLYFFPYLYFFLLDKSRWNNHSYLFALIVLLLFVSDAGNHLSIDSLKDKLEKRAKGQKVEKSDTVPHWNYFLFKFQFFILYFLAGIKKLDEDWILGYSMKNLSGHYIFTPLKSLVSSEIIDYYMIHLGGLFFDLFVGFMLNFGGTKKFAFVLSIAFHLMNSQLFHIGMFPYVCIASLVIFCEPCEFPCKYFSTVNTQTQKSSLSLSSKNVKNTTNSTNTKEVWPSKLMSFEEKKKLGKLGKSIKKETTFWTIFGIFVYICVQLFLPFSHSITKGYNNWTEGLYGYSWDMMVYSWDTLHVKITVKDMSNGHQRFLDPDVWVSNDRWSSHGDMAKQYAQCIQRNLAVYNMSDIRVYFDVWKSLNGRFQQRIFNPKVDILKAPWTPWEKTPWILPLLKEYSYYRREYFDEISKSVGNWSSSSQVIFVSDFPDLYLDNYLPEELQNVTLTLMWGQIVLEVGRDDDEKNRAENITLNLNDKKNAPVPTGVFHKVHTVSPSPSCYMYTYRNATADLIAEKEVAKKHEKKTPKKSPLPLCAEVYNNLLEFIVEKAQTFQRSFLLIANSYLNLLFNVPFVLRKQN